LAEEFRFRYYQTVLKQLGDAVASARAKRAKIEAHADQIKQAWDNYYAIPNANDRYVEMLVSGRIGDVGAGRVEVEAKQKLVEAKAELASQTYLRDAIKRAITAIEAAGDERTFGSGFIPREIRESNAAVRRLSELLADKVALRIELEQRYSPGYAELDDVRNEVARLRSELKGLLEEGLAEVEATMARIEARVKEYGNPGSVASTPENLSQLVTTFRDIQVRQKIFEDELAKVVDEENQAEKIYIGARTAPSIPGPSHAILPDKHVTPVVWLNFLVGGVVGLLLALAYLFLADFYDHTVRGTEDVERYLGVPVLTSVRRMGNPIRS
jgi:hypothetical protein